MRSMHAVVVSALAGLLFVSAAAAGCFEERHLSDVVGTGGQQSTGGGGVVSTSTGGSASCTTECCKAEDCPATAGPCLGPACNDGVCGFTPKAVGTSCSDAQNPNAKVCDGVAACVECNAVEECADKPICGQDKCVCADHTCILKECQNGQKDGSESDTDCGGDQCPKCTDSKMCGKDADCLSDVCTNGICQVPTCNDAKKNGAETDKDCGGGMCVKCGPNLGCNTDSDCIGAQCVGGQCAENCKDGVLNNGETSTDCGGPNCLGCIGDTCNSGADCQSMECNSRCCAAAGCGQCKACDAQGACGPLPAGSQSTCFNISSCDGTGACKLKTGEFCALSADCLSNYCVGNPANACGTCATDGDCFTMEPGYGCRAGACRKVAGEMCTLDIDCVSYNCVNFICAGCLGDADCSSGNCTNGRCLYESGMPCAANGNCASSSCNDPDNDGQKTCQP